MAELSGPRARGSPGIPPSALAHFFLIPVLSSVDVRDNVQFQAENPGSNVASLRGLIDSTPEAYTSTENWTEH